jgi:membrane protein DedA with SNARE-associated domain
MIDLSIILTKVIENFGYFGIFFLMMLESTVAPVPSELVLIPAGYLCYSGQMNMLIVIVLSTIGSLCGATINYSISIFFGRSFLLKYGKYIFFNNSTFYKIETMFLKYGSISTFIGRLLPIVRHFISIPAGIYKMNFYKFAIFTTIGASIWSAILVFFGYYLGQNIELFKSYAKIVNIFLICSIVIYIGYKVYSTFYLNEKRQK